MHFAIWSPIESFDSENEWRDRKLYDVIIKNRKRADFLWSFERCFVFSIAAQRIRITESIVFLHKFEKKKKKILWKIFSTFSAIGFYSLSFSLELLNSRLITPFIHLYAASARYSKVNYILFHPFRMTTHTHTNTHISIFNFFFHFIFNFPFFFFINLKLFSINIKEWNPFHFNYTFSFH